MMVLALAKEIQLRKEEFKNEVVETIYFGGGTPSVLAIEDLRLLIDEVFKNYIIIIGYGNEYIIHKST